VEKKASFKCGTFGASSLQQRHLATGDFEGKLMIWYMIFFNIVTFLRWYLIGFLMVVFVLPLKES
jgi:hypothetical protein